MFKLHIDSSFYARVIDLQTQSAQHPDTFLSRWKSGNLRDEDKWHGRNALVNISGAAGAVKKRKWKPKQDCWNCVQNPWLCECPSLYEAEKKEVAARMRA